MLVTNIQPVFSRDPSESRAALYLTDGGNSLRSYSCMQAAQQLMHTYAANALCLIRKPTARKPPLLSFGDVIVHWLHVHRRTEKAARGMPRNGDRGMADDSAGCIWPGSLTAANGGFSGGGTLPQVAAAGQEGKPAGMIDAAAAC
ncbi:hypothetical protein MRX96_053567 [Rhipicephalus microplus]